MFKFYRLDRESRTVRELEDDGSGEMLAIQFARRVGSDSHHVGYDVVDAHGGQLIVSTVFLGIDLGGPMGRSLFFETMVFDVIDGRREILYQHRAATLDEAEHEHARVLELCSRRTGRLELNA